MQIQSHNSEPNSLVRQLFVPSPIKVFLYILTAFVALILSNVINFWNYFYADPNGQQQLADIFGNGSAADPDSGLFSATVQGRLGQILVWGLIGIAIYVVIWFIKNILTNIRNDIVADEYVHPHSYSRTSYWRSIAIRKGFFVLISLVLIGYIFLCYKLLPILAEMFFNDITNLDSTSILSIVGTTIALALILHVFVVLSQLAIHSWRFISSDL